MHSGAPAAQKPNRPPTPFGMESLTYPVFAASGKWVLCNRYRVVRCAPVWPLRIRIVPNGRFSDHPAPRDHRSPVACP